MRKLGQDRGSILINNLTAFSKEEKIPREKSNVLCSPIT